MILVRVLFGLLIGFALRGMSPLLTGSGPEPGNQPSRPTPPADPAEASTDPDLADAAAPAPGTAGLIAAAPDNARARAPRTVRFIMAVLPVVSTLGFIFALAAVLVSITGWEVPRLGAVAGDWPLGIMLLSVTGLAIWVLWQVPRWQAAAWRQGTTLGDREIFDIENSARSTLGQILSGVAVLAGLIFAWQQLGNTSETLFVSQEGQITDRFTRAVDQLGNPDVTVRLGGIYALERISRDSARDHETVLEVLAAFARQRSQAEQAAADPGASAGTGPGNATPAVAASAAPSGSTLSTAPSMANLPSIRNLPLDIDVVLKVISRRNPALDGPDCINLSGIDLTGGSLANYNLSNVCLRDAKLMGANLRGADLAGVDLFRADFSSSDLDGANLSDAILTGAVFTGANLSRTNLDGATLTGATMAGVPLVEATLRGALLNGTDLTGAIMSGTDFTGADLLGADLTGAVMSGADFTDARNLTAEQINAANVDRASRFPSGIAATPDF